MTWDITQTTTVARYAMSQKSSESLYELTEPDDAFSLHASVRLSRPVLIRDEQRLRLEDIPRRTPRHRGI